ncbi:MAG TPA: nickel pincer cofactor biosynthesis protein LarC [Ktedonobacterales bacterium]|nr:nickel pincer cofactor biosynthesis protein LarC [Ktedonobacterales bacterium]
MLAYLDCFSGISGDMLLGALVDAGLDLDALREPLRSLPLAGYALEAEPVTDHGITGTRVRVVLSGDVPHKHRHLEDIAHLIVAAKLPERAQAHAIAIFRRLAEAEGAVHGTPPEDVTFHEVGAVDSIVDIVGAALGLELLGIGDLFCSELPLTSGRVISAHGALPVPAPATLELLKGTQAIWRPVPAEGELVTPTGAAFVATLARFARPTMRASAVGYGFGTRSLPWANCLRLVLGETSEAAVAADGAMGLERDEIVVIESNIDNMSGEALGWLMERLLAVGALDVSYTPLQMKKNRPATLLTVLVSAEEAERIAALVVRESGTLGVRMRHAQRLKAGRRVEEIETPLGSVHVKLKLIDGAVTGASPEYDDCRALAEAHGLPFDVVLERVQLAARRHFGLEQS